jgi:metallo-beta-lactamase family protein
VLHHLKQTISDPRNTILFTGFQAPHTLGRRILDGAKEVNIFGEPFEVRARVEKLEASSGHADQRELLDWAGSIAAAGKLRHVALVHGEPEPAMQLRERLLAAGISPVLVPAPGERMEMAL